jgi:hypothetical protein
VHEHLGDLSLLPAHQVQLPRALRLAGIKYVQDSWRREGEKVEECGGMWRRWRRKRR